MRDITFFRDLWPSTLIKVIIFFFYTFNQEQFYNLLSFVNNWSNVGGSWKTLIITLVKINFNEEIFSYQNSFYEQQGKILISIKNIALVLKALIQR